MQLLSVVVSFRGCLLCLFESIGMNIRGFGVRVVCFSLCATISNLLVPFCVWCICWWVLSFIEIHECLFGYITEVEIRMWRLRVVNCLTRYPIWSPIIVRSKEANSCRCSLWKHRDILKWVFWCCRSNTCLSWNFPILVIEFPTSLVHNLHHNSLLYQSINEYARRDCIWHGCCTTSLINRNQSMYGSF